MAVTNKARKKHNQVIVKANEIIQKAQHHLTEQQIDIIDYMVAEINEYDSPETIYTFSIRDFCDAYNLNNTSGYYYKSIKDDIDYIDRQRMFLLDDKEERIMKRIQWLNVLHYDLNSGDIMYNFHQDIRPYLFQLGNRKTIMKHKRKAALSGKYAKNLYELMKSYENMETIITIPLDRLKFVIDAEKYSRFPDFRRWALEPAIDEINRKADIKIYARYQKGNKGRAISQISFSIHRKEGYAAEIASKLTDRTIGE